MYHWTFPARAGVGLLALLLALAAGCGRGTKYRVVPVEGKIAFADGTPLPTGTQLVFNPDEGRMGTASAVTSGDGAFKVTHVTGTQGAEVGKYVVVLRAPEADPGNFYKVVPRDYYDAGVLSVEVKDGMQPLSLKVARAKKR